MLDHIQFKDAKNKYAKFGTFLIIFGAILIIQFVIGIIIRIGTTPNVLISQPFITEIHLNLLSYLYWTFLIVETIFFILMIYEMKKISNLVKVPKSGRIFTAFLIWFIFNLIFIILNVIVLRMSFLNTISPGINHSLMANDISRILIYSTIPEVIAAIFQLIAWIFMYSFINNTHDLFPENYKKKFRIYLILLIIFNCIVIVPYLIGYLMALILSAQFYVAGPDFLSIFLYAMVPSYYSILVFIGYLLLGIHLVKVKSSITQNIDATAKNEDKNAENNISK